MPATKKQHGFTLIELMVTIAIIAILAAVGIVVYSTAQKSGRISKRAQDLKAIQTALELYKSATGSYPNGTVALTYATCMGPLSVLVPSYMPILPADPLDNGNPAGTNCYQYASDLIANSTQYKIRTNPTISAGASPEMNSAAFLQQPPMIDSDRDGTADDNCAIQTSGTVTGWALYSGSGAICNL